MPLRLSALTTPPGVSAAMSFSIAVHIHDGVGGDGLVSPGGERCSAPCGVYVGGQLRGRDLEAVVNGKARTRRPGADRSTKGVEPVRKLSCQMLGGMVVMLPPAWAENLGVTCQAACTRGAQAFQSVLIAGLRIDDVLLRAVDGAESRRCGGRAR